MIFLGNTVLRCWGEDSSPHSPSVFTPRNACIPEGKDVFQDPSHSLCLLLNSFWLRAEGEDLIHQGSYADCASQVWKSAITLKSLFLRLNCHWYSLVPGREWVVTQCFISCLAQVLYTFVLAIRACWKWNVLPREVSRWAVIGGIEAENEQSFTSIWRNGQWSGTGSITSEALFPSQ